MNSIIKLISDRLEKAKQRRKEKKALEMVEISKRTVQVKEFDGELYISHNGIPLVNLNYLQNSIDVLNNARQVSSKYIHNNKLSFNAR